MIIPALVIPSAIDPPTGERAGSMVGGMAPPSWSRSAPGGMLFALGAAAPADAGRRSPAGRARAAPAALARRLDPGETKSTACGPTTLADNVGRQRALSRLML